jgi:hypothetical protein
VALVLLYQLQGIKGKRLVESSSGIISIPSFMKINHLVQKLKGGTHTQFDDIISVFSFLKKGM